MQNLQPVTNNHYEEVLLTDLVSICYGKDVSTKELDNSSPYPVFGANGIIGRYSKYTYKDPQVLVSCRGANSGQINISPPSCFITHNSLVVEPKNSEQVHKKYLYYALSRLDRSVIVTGTAQPQVTIANLAQSTIPMMSYEEQAKIADKLDLLIELKEKSGTQLKQASKQLQKFRQSVLSAAVTGKLTEEWREKNPSVETASLLLEKIIAEKIKIKKKNKTQANVFDTNDLLDLPSSWVFTTLGQVVIDFKYGTSEKSDYTFTGTPVLRIPNIVSGSLDLTDLKYLSTPTTNEDDFVRNGDILIVRSNGSRDLVGKNALVEDVKNNIAYASYLIKIRPLIVNPTFIWILLNSPLAKKQLFDQAKSAAGINNINTQELSSLTTPLPPLEEQQEIVKRVKSMYAAADLIEEQIETAGKKTDKLTQSILAKAFRGEL